MSEVLILHLGHGDEKLWNKLVDLLDENGYQINHLETVNKTSKLLKFDGLEIIPEQHQVFVNGREVVLTGKEFQILMLLVKNRGRVFSKEQIYDSVCEYYLTWEPPVSFLRTTVEFLTWEPPQTQDIVMAYDNISAIGTIIL